MSFKQKIKLREYRYGVSAAARIQPLVFFQGLVAALAGAALLLLPEEALPGSGVIREYLPVILDYAWPAFYCGAGVLMLCGLIRAHRGLEASGLILLAFTVAVYIVAILNVTPWRDAFIALAILFSVAGGATARAALIVFGRR